MLNCELENPKEKKLKNVNIYIFFNKLNNKWIFFGNLGDNSVEKWHRWT